MAKLVTVVQTYFKNGTYRNNRVEMQIPDEAAEIIRKYWNEVGVSKAVQAQDVASNEAATAELSQGEQCLGGITNMWVADMVEDEVFEQHFKDEEEDDEQH